MPGVSASRRGREGVGSSRTAQRHYCGRKDGSLVERIGARLMWIESCERDGTEGAKSGESGMLGWGVGRR